MGIEVSKLNNNVYFGIEQDSPPNANTPKLKDKNDSFEKVGEENKSNNGKFDISEAFKNFGKGLISPITALIKHPIAAIGIVGVTLAATTMVPVLAPILGVGFGLYSIFQIGKGTYQTIKNYQNSEYDKAEKSFNNIGEGVIGTVLSAFGIKPGAKIAKEAKMMNELHANYLTISQKEAIASEVNKGGFFNAIKENISLLTSETGLKAVGAQFKPDAIKTRITEIIKIIPSDFKNTEEGIRRAKLSDEQIKQEIQPIYDEIFDSLKIPKEQRPQLKIINDVDTRCGSYDASENVLNINSVAYKNGSREIENLIMHEATHCQEALLRAGIPKERAMEIVKNELLSRIMKGESEEIILEGGICGPSMIKPPKMSSKMKTEFAEFAKNNLYTNHNEDLSYYLSNTHINNAKEAIQPLLTKLENIINNNPEFISQYANKDAALNALAEYALSHNTRYNIFLPKNVGKVNIGTLSSEELARAEQSLVDSIDTIEGNARIAGVNGIFADQKSFSQYEFSPEEVLAQQKGNGLVVEKYTAKLKELRDKGTITPQEEARLIGIINKAEQTYAYETKGLEYYKKYTEMINNPNNKELAAEVRKLEKELVKLMIKANANETYSLSLGTNNQFKSVAPAIYNTINSLKGKQEK